MNQNGPYSRTFVIEPTVSVKTEIPRVAWVLLLVTVITTILAGTLQQGLNPFDKPLNFLYGIPFSFTLLLILGIHEFGHFIMCKLHNVPATVPYFIPMPNMLGTMGAFIKIKGTIPNRRALLDIGMSGPLAGFAIALPATIIGLILSTPVPNFNQDGMQMGSSLLTFLLVKLIFPSLPDGFNIILHPVGFAGMIGLLVTSLNLLPVGQLDGGHIASALFGAKQWKISKIFMILLIPLGMIWQGWWFWIALLILMGYRHPVLQEDARSLGVVRRKLAWLTIAIFVATFVPVPFYGM